MKRSLVTTRSFIVFLGLAFCVSLEVQFAHATNPDLKLQAILVWGTNEEKPADPKLKEMDPKLREKLKNVFKWKHYFEIKREPFSVSEDAPKQVTMSSQCKIEVRNLGNSMVEVKLFGDGKLVLTKRQAIPPNEQLVLAGDGKNDTAWFVVLTNGN